MADHTSLLRLQSVYSYDVPSPYDRTQLRNSRFQYNWRQQTISALRLGRMLPHVRLLSLVESSAYDTQPLHCEDSSYYHKQFRKFDWSLLLRDLDLLRRRQLAEHQ